MMGFLKMNLICHSFCLLDINLE